MVIVTLIVFFFVLTLLILSLGDYILEVIFKLTAPQLTSLFFGRIACQVDLTGFNSFDEYVNSFNSNKKREINKILSEEYEIRKGSFKVSYIKNLWYFLSKKYSRLSIKLINIILALFVFSLNQLNYWEYYHKDTKEFLGWSSYFIHNNVYYDFISSPKSINISTMAVHSIKYAFQQGLNIVDLGPTNCQLKMSKFNAKLIEL